MASTQQLETLIDLAQRETDDAAKRLGAALKAVAEAEEKLNMLVGYRDEYGRRFDASQQQGITPMAYRNFQAFMEKLDTAIQGQQEVLRHSKVRGDQEKQMWQDAERKRMSYSTLRDRAEAQELKKEAKRDQKAMDEHASRQAFFKR
ncbi:MULTISPECIES: flagellar export protein FliJ [unclassified Duganella]|uniref:flagellar export protein FliJ n=1 Tax=unclassified Duganella TaxID=2636909 RepID=UPI0006F3ECE7|nr:MULTISPECIES: flagellar export protein FliJ [unclassified Duganella]KQV54614.1 flagellar biosynthesis protein FliJ [Duganella sp. Root336D2]KRC03798.1 flagellar biosynthesis protein FliJ [Duganella sp. Root198D2]